MAERKGKGVILWCTAREPKEGDTENMVLRCRFKIFFRGKDEDRMKKKILKMAENSDGEEDLICEAELRKNLKYGIEGITPCPICKYKCRIARAKNGIIFFRCSICCSTIFVKPKYVSKLYGDKLVQIKELKWR